MEALRFCAQTRHSKTPKIPSGPSPTGKHYGKHFHGVAQACNRAVEVWIKGHEATLAASNAEDHAVQRVLSAAQNDEGERGDQQHQFEFADHGHAGALAEDLRD